MMKMQYINCAVKAHKLRIVKLYKLHCTSTNLATYPVRHKIRLQTFIISDFSPNF